MFYRATQSILLLLLATVVVFLILRLAPGDPALLLLGDQTSPEGLAQLRKVMGLDRPLPEQYLNYLSRLLRGDFGTSIRAQRPVLTYVGYRLPASLQLLAATLAFAILLGLPIGIIAAVRHRSLVDYSVMTVSLLGQSVPAFWLGLMLIVVFSVHLRLLPPSGRGGLAHLIMPSFTLGFYLLGLVSRLTRSEMLEVLSADYVRTARAKGLAERIVVAKHALRNALLPVVTVLGLQAGALLGGAVVTETVFSWPGIGSLAVQAVYQRDYPVVQGIVLLSATMFVLVNFLVDVMYLYLDPRIAYR
ncbi:MAG: ABC transporter permease [Armatimonadetes bacterium]|nr:ABC transporter permease [Armatimonadota bacterium]